MTGIFSSKTPRVAPTPSTPAREEVVKSGIDQQRTERQRQGRASTILAGDGLNSTLGDAPATNLGRKTLLGQ